MILHLCHHWFWITTLGVLLTITMIVKSQETGAPGTRELGSTDASHPTTLHSKLKAVLMNVTRLYPVLDFVPEVTNSSNFSGPTKHTFSSSNMSSSASTAGQVSTISTEDERLSELTSGYHIDRTMFASESVESRELPGSPNDKRLNATPDVIEQPSTHISHSASGASRSVSHRITNIPSDPTELLVDSDSSPMNSNQSERLEREIRKNNTTQSIDIKFHPSYEPGSDGLEHDKLSQHTQEYVSKISTTLQPVKDAKQSSESNFQEEIEVSHDTEEEGYTIFVTPPSPHSSNPNDLTSTTLSTSAAQTLSTPTPIEVVKKSENISKIKDKTVTEFKPKFSSKTKDKTITLLKPVTENSTTSGAKGGTLGPVYSSSSSPVEVFQDLTSPAPVLYRSSNSSRVSDYEVMNDSPVVQDNVTEVAFENTSISADYEEVNLTSSSSGNTSNSTRTSAHGRMLDVVPPQSPRAPQAHAEDLSNPWGSDDGAFNVAMMSGISFGVLALVTLLGAVSFIVYRRYRWNKPQTLSDKCSNPDSSGYIDDSTLRENSEEMYSLDNDSFLNSLEAMTIQNYWTDHVKHTKL